MQDYIRELGRLLVLQGSSTSKEGSVAARLEQVTIETSQLLGIIKSLNLKVYKAVILGRLDGAYHAGARGLTDEQYQFVTVWHWRQAPYCSLPCTTPACRAHGTGTVVSYKAKGRAPVDARYAIFCSSLSA